jgi:hypothetical protein
LRALALVRLTASLVLPPFLVDLLPLALFRATFLVPISSL